MTASPEPAGDCTFSGWSSRLSRSASRAGHRRRGDRTPVRSRLGFQELRPPTLCRRRSAFRPRPERLARSLDSVRPHSGPAAPCRSRAIMPDGGRTPNAGRATRPAAPSDQTRQIENQVDHRQQNGQADRKTDSTGIDRMNGRLRNHSGHGFGRAGRNRDHQLSTFRPIRHRVPQLQRHSRLQFSPKRLRFD